MSTETHPHLEAIAKLHGERGIRPADPLSTPLDQARADALAYQSLWNEPLPEVADVRSVRIPAIGGKPIELRVFRPHAGAEKLPVLVYFHGGGFVLNSLDTHERLMRLLALRSGAAVVGVGYAMAPELRFPGQLFQGLAAINWLRGEGGAGLGLDGGRLAVGGDSAGANLALAASLVLRDRRQPLPLAGLLFYGMYSADLGSPSHQKFGGGAFGLTTARVDWFWRQYLADFAQRDNPLAAPLWADLHGLPQQLVIAAGLDCLLDDSLRLAEKLDVAGVPNTLSVYEGVPHSFMQMSSLLAPADAAIHEAAALLRKALGSPARLAAE